MDTSATIWRNSSQQTDDGLPTRCPVDGLTNGELRLIKRRIRKYTIREIYVCDATILKRFIRLYPWADMRRVWYWEDRALRRLNGLPVPRTYGYKIRRNGQYREILYAREFITGEPIYQFKAEDMTLLAELLAKIHRRGVITRDPLIDNFIRTPDHQIAFVDFGRSLVTHPSNPVILAYIGKELARLRCHALGLDPELNIHFQKAYFRLMDFDRGQKVIIDRIHHFWYRRMSRKYGRGQR